MHIPPLGVVFFDEKLRKVLNLIDKYLKYCSFFILNKCFFSKNYANYLIYITIYM